MSAERLQKILAQWGIASRRQAEQLISAGAVTVNGQVAVLGQKVDPHLDCITVEGQQVGPSRPALVYLLLHKPLGVVTTCNDPWGRPTVLDSLPQTYRQCGLHPVGRLDAQSTGALLLTNDGDLTFALTHPTHNVTKTYEVEVRGCPTPQTLRQWRDGIVLEGRQTRPCQVRVQVPFRAARNTTGLEIVLQEGRKRQIRLVAKALGHPVQRLHRTKIGPVSLIDSNGQQLRPGEYRLLTVSEIETLQHIININIKGCTGKQKEIPV